MRARAFPLRLSASMSGPDLHRRPPPPNNSFKPTPCRGIGCVLYATLARIRRPATGRLNSGVRRQQSLRSSQRSSCSPLRSFQAGRRLQPLRSLASVSTHCFGKFAMRAHISRALRLPASVTMSAFRSGCWLQTLCFGSRRRKVHGARSSIPASVLRQLRRGSICIGVHRRLTIRSSRPHVVASAMCFTLR